MNLLLDTHVLLWWLEGNRRIGPKTAVRLRHPDTQVWISSVSIWEISIKMAIGRLSLRPKAERDLPALLETATHPLPISHHHAFALRSLPPHHADPFDRMLVVQAQCEDLVLATADSAIAAYDVRTLDVTL